MKHLTVICDLRTFRVDTRKDLKAEFDIPYNLKLRKMVVYSLDIVISVMNL